MFSPLRLTLPSPAQSRPGAWFADIAQIWFRNLKSLPSKSGHAFSTVSAPKGSGFTLAKSKDAQSVLVCNYLDRFQVCCALTDDCSSAVFAVQLVCLSLRTRSQGLAQRDRVLEATLVWEPRGESLPQPTNLLPKMLAVVEGDDWRSLESYGHDLFHGKTKQQFLLAVESDADKNTRSWILWRCLEARNYFWSSAGCPEHEPDQAQNHLLERLCT